MHTKFVGKLHGKRPRGRLKGIWDYTIKMGFKFSQNAASLLGHIHDGRLLQNCPTCSALAFGTLMICPCTVNNILPGVTNNVVKRSIAT
jgi:hypothetical protein